MRWRGFPGLFWSPQYTHKGPCEETNWGGGEHIRANQGGVKAETEAVMMALLSGFMSQGMQAESRSRKTQKAYFPLDHLA